MDAKLQQLSELLDVYFKENPRIRHEHSKNHYRWAIADLAEYLGRDPLVSDLSVERIAGLMVWLRDGRRRLTPAGVNGRRHRLGAAGAQHLQVADGGRKPDLCGAPGTLDGGACV